ncbi:MAG TPA: molybdopterin-dependent oxidoreductase [Bryobacteraceae bacterium]|jgi:anaerobic selenocysteine-containing dehydrogenase|nr:molybdopterin-dependent oxidoreductase [Bryobacteraceae bacterium]
MDRRNFFKIVSTVSAGVASSACGTKRDALIPLLVPDHEILPGVEEWHPGVCTECGAGCGVIARVMAGERIIERNGEKFRERIACVKKLEGNPLDPVSGGRLCARGHAVLQSLYNPDRISQPMRRAGDRGKGGFSPISWDEAIASVADKLAKAHASDPSKILFLTSPQAGSRSVAIQHFLQSLGAPAAQTCSLADFALERKAAASVFGWKGLPRYDLGNARYALGVGADFLGGWASPVYYARQFGQFRQARPGIRGKLVQAESRMSITAGSADEWLPVRPGSEPHLIVAIARVLLDEKLARNVDQVPGSVRDAVLAANLGDLIRASGIEERRLRRVARELGESDAPLVIAGASTVHTNSFDALVLAHYLNLMLGNIGRPGGVLPPNASAEGPEAANVPEALKRAQILLLDDANPLYTLPSASRVTGALARLDTIVSFGMFVDDSVAYADLILPSPHPLESGAAIVPTVSPLPVSINIATPFVQPLYNTRPIEQTLDAIARKMNIKLEGVSAQSFVQPFLPPELTWDEAARQGGVWHDDNVAAAPVKPLANKVEWNNPVFDGAPEQFPLYFQPYLSLQYHDGRGANLPWMQELPDPVSSAMWDLPVEIDPQTAARLHVETGDWVRVESPHGSLDATAYVHPAALPGVVSMAIGEGHRHYGRYASNRGANPLSVISPVWETSAGALAFGATRVKVARLERAPGLIQFSPNDREQGPWGYR